MRINVLVVDDSAVMRAMIVRTLTLSRLAIDEVHQAGNGREALNVLNGSRVQLALVDLNMPVMDGEALIAALRARKDTAQLPILVVSTEGSDTRLARIRQMGARFVRKPFTPETLRDAIIALTGVAQYEAEPGPDGGGDLDF